MENKTFLEKFVGGGIVDLDLHVEDVEDETCECVDIITLSGHAFLLLQNQFYPEAANCVRKFNVASDETLLYLAEVPILAEKEDVYAYEDSAGVAEIASPGILVEYESVLLTSRGLHVYRPSEKEVSIPWEEISTILDDTPSCCWYVYKNVEGKRVASASFGFSTLVGGCNSLNLKRWRNFFAQLVSVAYQTATADYTYTNSHLLRIILSIYSQNHIFVAN